MGFDCLGKTHLSSPPSTSFFFEEIKAERKNQMCQTTVPDIIGVETNYSSGLNDHIWSLKWY
jgi:hypothetical protein